MRFRHSQRPEWIHPFTGLKPAQFRRLVRLTKRGELV
jgi:hypothetical protein